MGWGEDVIYSITHCGRWAVALVAVIWVLLHCLSYLLQQKASLQTHLEYGALCSHLSYTEGIVALFYLNDAPLELNAFPVIRGFH